MKKFMTTVLVIAIMLTLVVGFGGVAQAANSSLTTTVTISPTNMTSPGAAQVKIKITNNGDPVTDVKVIAPGGSGEVCATGEIPAGQTVEMGGTWQVTEDDLGQSRTFLITWTDADGAKMSGSSPSFTIKKEEANATASISLSTAVTSVKSGDKCKFTFKIKNDGNTKIEKAYLTSQQMNGGKQMGDTFSIAPGETITKNWSEPLSKDTTATVTLTYADPASGTEKKAQSNEVTVKVGATTESAPPTESVDPNATPVAAQSLSVDLQTDKQEVAPGETINCTVTVTNTGTKAISNLSVTDPTGAPVQMSAQSLAAGETATGSAGYVANADSSLVFNVAGTEDDGAPVAAESNAVPVSTAAAPVAQINPSEVIKLGIELSTNKLTKPGDVTMTVTVSNLSQEPLSDIVVTDALLGTLTLPSLAAGESHAFDPITKKIEETTQFQYQASAVMPNGQSIQTSTPQFEVAVVKTSSSFFDMDNNTLLLLIIIVAAAAVAGVLIYLYFRGKKTGKGMFGGGGKSKPSGGRPSPSTRPQTASRATGSRPAGSRPQPTNRPQPSGRPQQRQSAQYDRPQRSAAPQQRPQYDEFEERQPQRGQYREAPPQRGQYREQAQREPMQHEPAQREQMPQREQFREEYREEYRPQRQMPRESIEPHEQPQRPQYREPDGYDEPQQRPAPRPSAPRRDRNNF